MSASKKKVFISYRRAISKYAARAVYQFLKGAGFDTFMDVENIDSGQFAPIILHQIEARPHFVIILTDGTLDRTVDSDDWLRREIEHALTTKRNVVPLLIDGFNFDREANRLQGKGSSDLIARLRQYNGLNVPFDYFDEAMAKLQSRFLKEPASLPTVTPTPQVEKKMVNEMIKRADKAEVDEKKNEWVLGGFAPFGKSRDDVRPRPRSLVPKLSLHQDPLNYLRGPELRWTQRAPGLEEEFLLQRSYDDQFRNPSVVYQGPETSFFPRDPLRTGRFGMTALLTEYFRVKVETGQSWNDSDWSNVVKLDPPSVSLSLKPPKLRLEEKLGVKKVVWDAVHGAKQYELEVSFLTENFIKSDPFKTERTEISLATLGIRLAQSMAYKALKMNYYVRCKAVGEGIYEDSDWSETLTVTA